MWKHIDTLREELLKRVDSAVERNALRKQWQTIENRLGRLPEAETMPETADDRRVVQAKPSKKATQTQLPPPAVLTIEQAEDIVEEIDEQLDLEQPGGTQRAVVRDQIVGEIRAQAAQGNQRAQAQASQNASETGHHRGRSPVSAVSKKGRTPSQNSSFIRPQVQGGERSQTQSSTLGRSLGHKTTHAAAARRLPSENQQASPQNGGAVESPPQKKHRRSSSYVRGTSPSLDTRHKKHLGTMKAPKYGQKLKERYDRNLSSSSTSGRRSPTPVRKARPSPPKTVRRVPSGRTGARSPTPKDNVAAARRSPSVRPPAHVRAAVVEKGNPNFRPLGTRMSMDFEAKTMPKQSARIELQQKDFELPTDMQTAVKGKTDQRAQPSVRTQQESQLATSYLVDSEPERKALGKTWQIIEGRFGRLPNTMTEIPRTDGCVQASTPENTAILTHPPTPVIIHEQAEDLVQAIDQQLVPGDVAKKAKKRKAFMPLPGRRAITVQELSAADAVVAPPQPKRQQKKAAELPTVIAPRRDVATNCNKPVDDAVREARLNIRATANALLADVPGSSANADAAVEAMERVVAEGVAAAELMRSCNYDIIATITPPIRPSRAVDARHSSNAPLRMAPSPTRTQSGCPFRALGQKRQGLAYGLHKHNHSMTPKIPLVVKEEPIDEQFKLADLEKEIHTLAQRLSLLFRIEKEVFVLMLPTEAAGQWLSRLLMLRDDNSSIRLAEFTGSSEAFAEKAEHWFKSDFDGPQQLMEALNTKCVEYFQQQKMAQDEDNFLTD